MTTQDKRSGTNGVRPEGQPETTDLLAHAAAKRARAALASADVEPDYNPYTALRYGT